MPFTFPKEDNKKISKMRESAILVCQQALYSQKSIFFRRIFFLFLETPYLYTFSYFCKKLILFLQ